jgi:tRNA 2-thiouridine synthesizing protein A
MAMLIEVSDTRGLKSPEHVLKIAARAPHMKPGGVLEVLGDHPGFEKDVRFWCEETGRVILSVESDGESTKIIQIQF